MRYPLLLSAFALSAVLGCSRAEQEASDVAVVAVHAPAEAPAGEIATYSPPAGSASPSSSDAEAPVEEEPSSRSTISEFKPPFPGKRDVFAPPRVERAVPRIEPTDNESTVRLIGFVELEGIKAVLSFDGKVRSMEVGDVYQNVEIVKIEPPSVMVQRDHKRWNMALFDQPIVHSSATNGPLFGDGQKVTIGTSSTARSNAARNNSPFSPPSLGESGSGLALPGFLNPVDSLPGAPALPGMANDGDAGLPGLDADSLPALPGLP